MTQNELYLIEASLPSPNALNTLNATMTSISYGLWCHQCHLPERAIWSVQKQRKLMKHMALTKAKRVCLEKVSNAKFVRFSDRGNPQSLESK